MPAGEFLYGERKERRRIPYTYWIAKYPLTNAQFARFIADDGYMRRELWSEEGWSWRIGTYDSKAPDYLRLVGATPPGELGKALLLGWNICTPTLSSPWSG